MPTTLPTTEAGQIFRMDMHYAGHPDGDYQTVNKVAVLESPHVIGWLTGYEKDDGQLEFGGWIWRYGPDHLINSLHHLAALSA